MRTTAGNMNILIVKTSSLGDIVHALPVLTYLRRVAPQARIDWVVDEAFAELLRHHANLDTLFVVPLRRWKKAPFKGGTWRDIGRFLGQLRTRRYDLVFDLQGNLKSGILCGASRGARKIGFAARNVQEKASLMFTRERVDFAPEDRHAVQRYLRVVASVLGAPSDPLRDLPAIATTPDDDGKADALLAASASPRIVFHCGTSWASKLWSEAGWIALGQALVRRAPTTSILLTLGDEAEHARAQRVATGLGDAARVLPRMGLKELCAVFKHSDLMVGADTGPVHLAAASGTPTVSLYRCTIGARNGPYGPRHRIVQAPMDCSRCWSGTCWRDAECTESITPQAMLAACEGAMAMAAAPASEPNA